MNVRLVSAVFLVGSLVGCRTSTRNADISVRLQERTPEVTELSAVTIDGVATKLQITPFNSKTAQFSGKVRILSTSGQAHAFRLYEQFFLHLRLESRTGDGVSFLPRFGIPDPAVRTYSAEAAFWTDIPFEVPLHDYFALKSGIYNVRFIYDMRLTHLRPQDGQFIVPWSKEFVQIEIE